MHEAHEARKWPPRHGQPAQKTTHASQQGADATWRPERQHAGRRNRAPGAHRARPSEAATFPASAGRSPPVPGPDDHQRQPWRGPARRRARRGSTREAHGQGGRRFTRRHAGEGSAQAPSPTRPEPTNQPELWARPGRGKQRSRDGRPPKRANHKPEEEHAREHKRSQQREPNQRGQTNTEQPVRHEQDQQERMKKQQERRKNQQESSGARRHLWASTIACSCTKHGSTKPRETRIEWTPLGRLTPELAKANQRRTATRFTSQIQDAWTMASRRSALRKHDDDG